MAYAAAILLAFDLGRRHQHGSRPMLADQHAPCDAGIGCYIEGVGAQQFQSLIEVGMSGFSFHDCVPVWKNGVQARRPLPPISHSGSVGCNSPWTLASNNPAPHQLEAWVGQAGAFFGCPARSTGISAPTAKRAWPCECCGALLGHAIQGEGPDGWQVDWLVRAANVRAGSSRDRYEIAPEELVRIVLEADKRGLEVAGFYHSHPGHPAQPSSIDLAEAHWLGCPYVITEVAEGKAALTNAFLLAGTTRRGQTFCAADHPD